MAPDSDPILWPNNEAFVGTEITRHGVREKPLSEFGDTSHYDWAPPHLETDLPTLSHCAVIHPVLDGVRYVQSLIKLKCDLEGLFQKESKLAGCMENCDPTEVLPIFLRHFVDQDNWSAVAKLRDYAYHRIGKQSDIIFNVAKGKPATQSSTSQWSHDPNVARDAAGAVSGCINGRFGFHTDLEESPWWCVDLEKICPVREIRIYNRMDLPARSRFLVVMCSTDLINWVTLYQSEGSSDFGGADGRPLRISPIDPVQLRFLRIHIAQRQMLHLDEVEVLI